MSDSDAQVSPCFPGLPDHLAWTILEWSRPDDENQFIWKWLCCVAGTCRQFRRLVHMEDGVPRSLLPTFFQLRENYYYLNEDPPQDEPPMGPVSLRVDLMETIRSSAWMGSHITRVCAMDNRPPRNGFTSVADIFEVRTLLTAECMPNLEHVTFRSDHGSYVDDRFLRGLAQQHPGLATLTLSIVGGRSAFDVRSPNTLATLARSMPQLQEVSIPLGFEDNHAVTTFVSNLNQTLTSLALSCARQDGFDCLQHYLPNLQSLTIASTNIATISTLRIANIIRSKRSLSHLAVFNDNFFPEILTDQGVITTINDMQLPLEKLRVPDCKWLNDASIMSLLRGQIQTGQITLTNLGIMGTSVSPRGMRAFLMEWRESNPTRSLTVEVFDEDDGHEEARIPGRQQWRQLALDFPDVVFDYGKRRDHFLRCLMD